MRRAQAVLWPHYLLAYFEMFARDWERLGEARRRANVLPLGSGALAGSGFPFDREAMAQDLGFAAVTRNSMDVSGDRDFALDFLYAASVTMIHLSRLAEDWILYSSEEFGWLELGDGVTSGSSLMPQKKNPDSLELIRGKSGRVMGCLTSLMVTMKGLPMTYNRDMQEDKVPLFEAADQLSRLARNGARGDRIGEAESGRARRRRGRKLGGGHGPGGGAGPRRHAVSPGAPDWPGDSCWKACAAARSPPTGRRKRCSASRRNSPAISRRCWTRKRGMQSREIPGGTGPQSVAAALAAARQRLSEMNL